MSQALAAKLSSMVNDARVALGVRESTIAQTTLMRSLFREQNISAGSSKNTRKLLEPINQIQSSPRRKVSTVALNLIGQSFI